MESFHPIDISNLKDFPSLHYKNRFDISDYDMIYKIINNSGSNSSRLDQSGTLTNRNLKITLIWTKLNPQILNPIHLQIINHFHTNKVIQHLSMIGQPIFNRSDSGGRS